MALVLATAGQRARPVPPIAAPFNGAVLTGQIKVLRGLLMPLALRFYDATFKRDSNGNPSLHRGGAGKARIDHC